jgi:hypothetical protein
MTFSVLGIDTTTNETLINQVDKDLPVERPIPSYKPDPRFKSLPRRMVIPPHNVQLETDAEHGALIVEFDNSRPFLPTDVRLYKEYEGQYPYFNEYIGTIKAYPVGEKKLFSRQHTINLAVFPHVKTGRYEFYVMVSRIEAKVIVQIEAGHVGVLDLRDEKK